VILSTHIVSDVEATATDIALISQGVLVAHATPEELLRQVEGRVWEWIIPSAQLNAAKQKYLISSTVRRSDGVHVRVLAEKPPVGAVPILPNLEDAYLYCLSKHRAGAAA
jgi:ABC-type multidrug transport system ATPase subunit